MHFYNRHRRVERNRGKKRHSLFESIILAYLECKKSMVELLSSAILGPHFRSYFERSVILFTFLGDLSFFGV